jgi:hypothetical protein
MKAMRNSGDISAHKAGASILFPSMLRIIPDSQSADIKAERQWTSRRLLRRLRHPNWRGSRATRTVAGDRSCALTFAS